MFIRNESDKAKAIAKNIENAAANFKLNAITAAQDACINISVETDCVSSYEEGRSFATRLQNHVKNASGYIRDISTIFEVAEEKVVHSIRNLDPSLITELK